MELLQHLRIGAHANRLANHRLHAALAALAHLYMHQTHHRGQVHAMLSGTAIKPPQLDEFLMPSDAPFREAEMRELGWREDEIYR